MASLVSASALQGSFASYAFNVRLKSSKICSAAIPSLCFREAITAGTGHRILRMGICPRAKVIARKRGMICVAAANSSDTEVLELQGKGNP
ncbi:uncharacterized protein LOC110110442 [Dendrobium catenatum]|uniref:uncharacterized protein LOC110110442 n=1 Tax=Dendrobium catenatum TaxID=906689 RepID=UPI0010A0776E|nr:uncharacterized protein LOC110110442 [Dendrobium catenatum]